MTSWFTWRRNRSSAEPPEANASGAGKSIEHTASWRLFLHGRALAADRELCPCLADLVVDEGREPTEALIIGEGFAAAKRDAGESAVLACDHASPVACLMAATDRLRAKAS